VSEYTEGQPVVVIERRHPLAYEEGTVNRPGPDSLGRVRVDFVVQGGDNGSGKTWTAIEREALAPVPQIGERRRWRRDYRAGLYGLGPFTLASRSTEEGRVYTVRYDASWADGIASASELARFSDIYAEPDGAEDGTVPARRAEVEPPRNPYRNPKIIERIPLGDVRRIARQYHQGHGKRAMNLDTLRDIVLETALAYEAGPVDGPAAIELRDAVRAYRTARDS
jgi:hypothetical protein